MAIPLWLQHAIETYGYWIVLLAVALESMGVPFPGETTLVAGAVYAGTSGRMNIVGVILFAAIGAIAGDNAGFAVGRYGGYPLLQRLTKTIHLDPHALDSAQGFFERHGNKTVFLGRYFSLLRTYVAFLAGVNRMPWRDFLLWNALGGITWSLVYGILGFVLGHNLPLLNRVLTWVGTGGVIVLGLLIALAVGFWIRHRRNAKAAHEFTHPVSGDE